MATDSSQMENAQSIYASRQRPSRPSCLLHTFNLRLCQMCLWIAYLRELVYGRQHYSQHGRTSQQVFDFECILIRVVGGLEIDEHEVYDVGLAGNEDNLEDCVPKAFRRIGPEEICVAGQRSSKLPIRAACRWL